MVVVVGCSGSENDKVAAGDTTTSNEPGGSTSEIPTSSTTAATGSSSTSDPNASTSAGAQTSTSAATPPTGSAAPPAGGGRSTTTTASTSRPPPSSGTTTTAAGVRTTPASKPPPAPLPRRAQTITFPSLGDQEYGVSRRIPLGARASSGLTVSYDVVQGKTSCKVEGTVVITLYTGPCTIRATQPGNDQWFPAIAVEASMEVVNGSSSFVLSGPNAAAVGAGTVSYSIEQILGSHEFSVDATGDCAYNDDLAVGAASGSFSVSPLQAGSCTITVYQDGTDVWVGSGPQTKDLTVSA
jgi:hypothetical protein